MERKCLLLLLYGIEVRSPMKTDLR